MTYQYWKKITTTNSKSKARKIIDKLHEDGFITDTKMSRRYDDTIITIYAAEASAPK